MLELVNGRLRIPVFKEGALEPNVEAVISLGDDVLIAIAIESMGGRGSAPFVYSRF